jgi:hypothetical protein
MKIFLMAFSLFFINSCSCSKQEEETYSPSQMWGIAKDHDPNVELVSIGAGQPHKRVLCKNYGPGCVEGSGKRIKVRKVELITIQFKTVKAARNEAIRLDQYHFANWLFDEVEEEPVLQHFVKKVFKAVKPKEEGNQEANLERK